MRGVAELVLAVEPADSPTSLVLQQAFFGLFTGETANRWGWLEYVAEKW